MHSALWNCIQLISRICALATLATPHVTATAILELSATSDFSNFVYCFSKENDVIAN